MNDLTVEWVEKAESDYRVAARESQGTEQPSFDAVCFHAQQCMQRPFCRNTILHLSARIT
jgi:HEPN domain-containing protein